MDQRQQNPNNTPQKENPYTLHNLFSKLNKPETPTFGNYCVNYIDMFPKEEECKDYFKNHVSLFNDDRVYDEKFLKSSGTFKLPKYFENLEEKTLFYIFYYMPRDVLQLYAAEGLYRKGWVYNIKFQIWFKNIKESEKYIFFNPLEWKNNEYIFGPINSQHFLPIDEVREYIEQQKGHKKDKKMKQGHRGGNINNNININQNNNNNVNNSQKIEQKNNNE